MITIGEYEHLFCGLLALGNFAETAQRSVKIDFFCIEDATQMYALYITN